MTRYREMCPEKYGRPSEEKTALYIKKRRKGGRVKSGKKSTVTLPNRCIPIC